MKTADVEQVITFLDDAPSLRHRQFADEIRKAERPLRRFFVTDSTRYEKRLGKTLWSCTRS